MKHSLTLSCFVFVGLVGCASTQAKHDPICEPLLDFVESVGADEERSILFRTSWGGNFRDAPEPVMFAKRCEQAGYAPAMIVCDALMEHAAVEFSGRNAERAMACLAPETHFGQTVSPLHGPFDIGYGTPDRGGHTTVSYQADEKLGGMVLSIEVDGY